MKAFLLTLLTLTLASWTQAATINAQDFSRLIRDHREQLEEIPIYGDESHGPLDKKLFQQLLAVAQDQANVWMDTILEGDYQVEGDVELVFANALYFKKQLVGYRVNYQQSAWYTGSCDYDYENAETLQECTPGSIQETSVVSADFSVAEIDGDEYANFID